MSPSLPNRYTLVNSLYTNTAVVASYQNGNIGNMKKKTAHNNIEILRKRLGITRPQLAERLNTTETTIYRKERGDRKLSDREAKRYAEALRCEPEELFGDVKGDSKPIVETDISKLTFGEVVERLISLEGTVKELSHRLSEHQAICHIPNHKKQQG